jgi:tRNA G18 (ribose-2'-O)-methylase SpoU
MSEAFVAGRRAVTEAIRAGDVTDLYVVPNAKVTEGLRAVLEAATSAGITVQILDRAELDARAPAHQGVLARVREPDVPKELSERDIRTSGPRRGPPRQLARRCSSREPSAPPT